VKKNHKQLHKHSNDYSIKPSQIVIAFEENKEKEKE
jgi:hypothetical protein